MATYTNYKDSITAVISNLKTLFGNTTMNEAQAIAASSTKPNTIFYTSDTHNIVLNGQIYGRSSQVTANAFAYLPASVPDPSGDPSFGDTTKIYIQPTSTAGVMKLWWYIDGSWVSTDTQAMSVPISAEDITYDLTNTPDLGEGDVQSAIEALSDETLGKNEVVEVDMQFEKRPNTFYGGMNQNAALGDGNALSLVYWAQYACHFFRVEGGQVFHFKNIKGAKNRYRVAYYDAWDPKTGTNGKKTISANVLKTENCTANTGTFFNFTTTAPSGALMMVLVTAQNNRSGESPSVIYAPYTANSVIEIYRNETKKAISIADNTGRLIDDWDLMTINTSSLVVGGTMPFWATATVTRGKRLEVTAGQVLLLDLVMSSTRHSVIFTDENRVITEMHSGPTKGAVVVPNDGFAYLMDTQLTTDNYIYNSAHGAIATKATSTILENDNLSDLLLSDVSDNGVVDFTDGHIATEKFDSRNITLLDSSMDSDFEISDEKGNAVLKISDGHIMTEKFDSSNINGGLYARRIPFKVKVDTNNYLASDFVSKDVNYREVPTYYEDNCVLYLPNSYKGYGVPTKLIMYCKHGASTITPTTDDIITGDMGKIFRYMLSLGYGILGADGLPDGWATELGLCERVVGNYVAVQSAIKAWEYAKINYNIDTERVFIFGYSQGGHYVQNIIDNSSIPIVAAAELSPVCSMRYHQWDLSASVTVGGVTFDKGARLNVARIFNFPAVTSNAELNSLAYDESKVLGFDPWVRNVENPYVGFTQSGNLWTLPSGTSIDDITMKKHLRCPLKIWCADNDNALGVDVMKVFIKAVKNAGQDADIQVYTSGAHSIPSAQTAVGTFVENGDTVNLYPIALDIADWFYLYGGY